MTAAPRSAANSAKRLRSPKSPIPSWFRAQQVELERDAPERGVAQPSLPACSSAGERRSAAFRQGRPVRVDPQSVIADSQAPGHKRRRSTSGLRFRSAAARAWRRIPPLRGCTVFFRDRPTHDLDPPRQRERDGKGRTGVPHHHYRRKRAIRFCLLHLRELASRWPRPRPPRPLRRAGAADLRVGLTNFAGGVPEPGSIPMRSASWSRALTAGHVPALRGVAIDQMTDQGPNFSPLIELAFAPDHPAGARPKPLRALGKIGHTASRCRRRGASPRGCAGPGYFVLPGMAAPGKPRHDFGAPDCKDPPVPIQPLRMRRAGAVVPVELGRAEGLLGGRVGNPLACRRVLEFRKSRELLTAALANRFRQLRPRNRRRTEKAAPPPIPRP